MHVYEEEIDPIDFPSYLAAQPIFPKWYQKCKNSGQEIAALGAWESYPNIPSAISSDRIYGALSFPSAKKDLYWKDFPSCFFFLPQVEIIQSKHKTIRRTRGSPLIVPGNSHVLNSILLDPIPVHCPSYETWNHSVEKALESIQRKEVQKLVLARRTTFQRQGNPFAWLSHLLHTSRTSTVFAFQMTPSSLFLGSTPEHLYHRTKRNLETESIAGTQKQDSSVNMFQNNSKELLEVTYVKMFLEQSLTLCCKEYSADKTCSLVHTSHLKHLRYRLQGLLKTQIADKDLLSLLHPTPAVGGFPKKDSLHILRALEPFDRGLYAGVMGWLSEEEASFAVTIRSALIESSFLHAFAGCGIVQGSNAHMEWQELDSKIAHWSPPCP